MDKDVFFKNRSEEATIHEKTVLFLLNNAPSKATRLQKLSLVIEAALNGGIPEDTIPHNFGGFNQEIDDALKQLEAENLVNKANSMFRLALNGKELLYYLQDEESMKVKELSENLGRGLAGLTDKEIISIVYTMFPSLTKYSLIPEVEKIGKKEAPPIELKNNLLVLMKKKIKNTIIFELKEGAGKD